MTIQWVIIASFLYLELGIIVLLILPFISPRVWKSLLRFRLWKTIEEKANAYFMIFLIVLLLFFLDSIREMIKYSGKHSHDYEAELQMQMKLFRSQRNYYIVGFAIFLSLVIRRLAMLILMESDLLIKNEIAMKGAQEATENLQKLTKEVKESEVIQSLPDETFLKEIAKLDYEIKSKDSDIMSAEEELENLRNRNEQISKGCEDLLKQISELKAGVD
ncbi:b-cell receptor-associated protein 29 [Nephila pilipes]|uniref:Endoplasmic reticulum transmembrane protein n=1 Tax=Nephila pilipes TaxID=299642 RepID=A0A8X6MA92_NEPPI|nr:b-cell receptor-associated protein 29 [Nephila pilipes]